MTRLYARWAFCVGDNCPESGGGKCRMGLFPVNFPADGKCLHPEYVELEGNGEWEKLGAFERVAGTELEKRFEKCEAACHALVDEISKLQKRARDIEDRVKEMEAGA